MAFKFKNLEQYFLQSKKNRQPVGTSVNPLGKFTPKPIQQQFSQQADKPTQEIDTDQKQTEFSTQEINTDQNKVDFSTQEINTDQNKVDFSTQSPKPFDKSIEFSTQEINMDQNGIEYSTQIPTSPLSGTPEKSTLAPRPFGSTPEKSTLAPRPFGSTPGKSTVEPRPFGATPEKSTLIPLNPMVETPFKSTQDPLTPMAATPEKMTALLELYASLGPSDRTPIFSAQGSPKINHMNNMTSGFLQIDPQPDKRDGTSKFMFSETLPQGGSSSTFTRLQYNKYFARTAPTDDSFAGRNESIPAGATENIRSMRISNDQADMFYKKVGKNDFVDIRTEAERNNPRSPLWLKSPFIQRGIQRGKDNPTGLFERINVLTAPVIDAVRIAKYMVSPDGLFFNLKQFGLQATNPKKQFWQLGLPNADRIYNPLALALQVPLSALGIHGDRHFLGQLNTRDITYEKIVGSIENLNPANPGDSNRLVKLGEDMEVGLFKNPTKGLMPQKLKGLEMLYTKFTAMMAKMRGKGEPIKRLSGVMGPHSFFGIGQSTMYKHTSGRRLESVFLYTPGEPYYKQKATTHYDDGKVSEAQKGEKNEDLSLGILTFNGDGGYQPSVQDTTDSWKGFPKNEGDIDPAGVNTGTYKVKKYNDIHDKIGNDLGDNKYGNPDLESFDQSKFGTDSDNKGAPTAKKNTGDELFHTSLPNSGEIAPGSGDKQFDVFGHMDIGNYRRAPKSFRDFRKKDDGDSYSGNSVTRISIKDYGATKPGESDDDTNYDSDYVKIRFNDDIALRAYITEISDGLKPTYSTISYAGNPVDAYMFDKISREWTLGLTMPAFTSGELKNNYKIMNDIMGYVSPKMYSGVGGGRIQTLTVGSLWQEVPCIVDSFDYTVNLDAGWDINYGEGKETSGHELPMLFDIKISGKFLVNADGTIWQSGGQFFKEEIWA
tara:strand:+ start:884 stop:3700 length:2817 start_codon:yes stop_codon:yes gene_type:complete